MAKNSKRQTKNKRVCSSELDINFLIAQNKGLKKQNTELQAALNKQSESAAKCKKSTNIIDSLGAAIVKKYIGASDD